MKRFFLALSTAFLTMAFVAQTSLCQEREKATGPPSAASGKSGSTGAKEYPLYITFEIHIETGKDLDEKRFRDAAAELRGLAEVFKKNGATLAMDSDEPFALACAKYGDNVLLEMEKKYGFSVGSYPHGNPCAATKAAVDALGVANKHMFGNWSKRRNQDWVADAKASGFKYTCAAQAMVLPEVEIEAPWDHETVPWSRADRIHPWRIKSTEEWQVHDPSSTLVYIPGDSGGIQGLYEKDLTGDLARPMMKAERVAAEAKRTGSPAPLKGAAVLDSRDIDVAIENMKKTLVFADKDKINTWYLVTNVSGRDRWDQYADLFEDWIKRVNAEFVKRGLVEWKTMDEMYDAYVEWEKRSTQ